jgi:hypothetical protein
MNSLKPFLIGHSSFIYSYSSSEMESTNGCLQIKIIDQTKKLIVEKVNNTWDIKPIWAANTIHWY